MKVKKILLIIGIVLCCLTLIGILTLPMCVRKVNKASAYVVDSDIPSTLKTTALYGSNAYFYTAHFGNNFGYEYYSNNFYFENKFPQYPSGTSLTSFQNGYIVNYLSNSFSDLMFIPFDNYTNDDNYFYLEYSTNYDFVPLNSFANPFVSFKWDNYYMTFEQFNMLINYFVLGHNNVELGDNRYYLSIDVKNAQTGQNLYYSKTSNLSVYHRLSSLINYEDLVSIYNTFQYDDITNSVAYLDITINCYQFSNYNRNVLYFTVPIVDGSTVNLWNDNKYVVNEIYVPSPLDIIINSIDSFLNIEVFPNFKLSYFLMISTAVLMVGIGTKLFLGD